MYMYCDEISSPIVVRVVQLSKFVVVRLTKSPIALFSFVPKGRPMYSTLDHSSITEAASDGLASRLLYGKRTSPQLTSFNQLPVTSL